MCQISFMVMKFSTHPMKLHHSLSLPCQQKWWYLMPWNSPWNSHWDCPKAIPSGCFIRVSCTLNRKPCHHFRWCGTDLMRREIKWVSSRWNHVCTVTNTWWILELNRMRAYEIANIKQYIMGVSFIHGFICVLVMWHSWKQQNETTHWD